MTKVATSQLISNETVLVGIDKHLKSWSITIYADGKYHKPMTMPGKSEALVNHLRSKYPGRPVTCAHEAGFCGFSAHRSLSGAGFRSVMVNASDVSSSGKDLVRKTDSRDSLRLLQDLLSGRSEALHVPTREEEALRDLARHYRMLSKEVTAMKNRVRSFLYKLGKESELASLPGGKSPWTRGNLSALKGLDLGLPLENWRLSDLVGHLEYLVNAKKETRAKLLGELSGDVVSGALGQLVGLGELGRSILRVELLDITRFGSRAKLRAYSGLVPDERSSGEQQSKYRMTRRSNKVIKDILIQAAWVSTRYPGVLSRLYTRLVSGGMRAGKAIVRVAAKLLDMVYHAWHRALRGEPVQDAKAS